MRFEPYCFLDVDPRPAAMNFLRIAPQRMDH
jgi:hypothetical protein